MMKEILAFTDKRLNALAWVVAIVTVILAVIAWGQTNDWRFFDSSLYRLFPLFGLIAFSLFWVQYVVAGVSMFIQGSPARLSRFFGVTSLLVFIAILLHPGLLSYQLWVDGYGSPPMSVLNHAVLPGYEWIVLLGMTSWVIFMTYLVTYRYHQYFQTKKWWTWFGYAGELGMVAVFYHGFRLGDQLQMGWFRGLWLVYGVVLIVAFACLHKDQLAKLFHKK